ncbi:DUF3267 domain-containing protein [Planococcus salinus]|uniref:DUF3267 domain-containing protein n=1 Tax=Planococcus salinus TaxID=1848460 RepID=A0A3M8P6W7_9BACL|nr:DUF3267 domain-containing protein [Planococcus salinus]RNF39413.1 DUF3267 domain-containing protein [Planococcus salinus]
MHCWKTINVKKQYGFDRLFMLSSLSGLGVFMIFYVALNIFYSATLSDQYFLLFLLSMIALYPLHKLCHFLPLVGCRRSIRLVFKKQLGLIPLISLRIKEPVPKMHFIFALISPFLLINSSIILLVASMPAYSHYFAMLFAFHCALCLTDLVYIRNLSRSPKYALIEETENGFQILVPQVIS